MNRAELRRIEREKKQGEAIYHLTRAEIDKIKLDVAKDAVSKAVNIAMAAPILMLHDHFGFGRVRIERLIGNVADLHDSIIKGFCSLDDLIIALSEETGIDLREHFNGLESEV